jgi:hypothetical protein
MLSPYPKLDKMQFKKCLRIQGSAEFMVFGLYSINQ